MRGTALPSLRLTSGRHSGGPVRRAPAEQVAPRTGCPGRSPGMSQCVRHGLTLSPAHRRAKSRRSIKAGFSVVEMPIQITPSRVQSFDEIDLPSTRVVLDVLFPLNGSIPSLMSFIPDKQLHVITAGESANSSCPVFMNSSVQVSGDTNIQCTISAACHDIYPRHAHAWDSHYLLTLRQYIEIAI